MQYIFLFSCEFLWLIVEFHFIHFLVSDITKYYFLFINCLLYKPKEKHGFLPIYPLLKWQIQQVSELSPFELYSTKFRFNCSGNIVKYSCVCAYVYYVQGFSLILQSKNPWLPQILHVEAIFNMHFTVYLTLLYS